MRTTPSTHLRPMGSVEARGEGALTRRRSRTATDRATVCVIAALVAVGTMVLPARATASADATAPSLQAFSLDTPGPLAQGATLSLSYSATDDASGVASVVFHFTDPLGQDRAVTGDAVGPATTVVGADWPTGHYRLDDIDVIDAADNTISYAFDGTTSTSPPDPNAPATHAFQLNQGDFAVDNGSPQLKPPLQGLVDIGPTIPAPPWQSVVNTVVVPVHWADLQPTQGGPIAAGNAIDAAIYQARQL